MALFLSLEKQQGALRGRILGVECGMLVRVARGGVTSQGRGIPRSGVAGFSGTPSTGVPAGLGARELL